MENKKVYDSGEITIFDLLMSENGQKEDFKEFADDYRVFGYVIGHWTTGESPRSDEPLLFRRVIKKEDITEEWINDIDEETEFIGVLFHDFGVDDFPITPEFTMFLDKNSMTFGYYHIGVKGDIRYP